MKSLIVRFVADKTAATAIEYGLIAGLIAARTLRHFVAIKVERLSINCRVLKLARTPSSVKVRVGRRLCFPLHAHRGDVD
jgi:hypothetical protein